MRIITSALLFAVLATGTLAPASSPNLGAIRPPGAQRGTEIELTLSGARLGDAKEILYYQPGIETLSLEKIDDNSVKARLKIAPDCALGLHDLRLRTATGLSELRTFNVGAYPEISEAEPNNDFEAPQPIALGTVVNGVAENEDIDYFVVEAKKGDRLSAEVEGIRLGITHFDPYLSILDSKRFELATSDDRALVKQDGQCSLIVPEDGKYIIAVRESAYAGNGSCLYRLHVGNFPRPTATLPAGGPPGQPVEITWLGDPKGPTSSTVTLPQTFDPNNFGLYAADDRGAAPYPNAFRLVPLPNVLEVEPNNDHATATAFAAPAALNGLIDKDGDTDYFSFPATKGQVLDINVYARRLRSPLDPVLHVAKKGGAYIAGADDSAGPDSTLRFTAPEDGDYVVYLHDHLTKGSPESFYRIELTPVAPRTVMSVTTEQIPLGTGAIAAAIPRGNRQAVLVTASRVDWGGDLAVEIPDLPPGVAVEADVLAASQPVVPVLFTAAADAPLGATLLALRGKPVDANLQAAASEFQATSILVLGANNVNFYSRTLDRLAVGVIEEAPYSIEIVEPKAPLVRNGTMSLKVVAKRAEGFTAPIAVTLPWVPPGVGASGGVSIPEGQTEALIPINANGNAELRDWKIVVNGAATTPSGPMVVSSQLAKLTVAEPYVGLTFQNATVDQGKGTDLLVQIQKLKDFPGEAQVILIGLPNKATTEPRTITQETADIIFPIKTDPETPDGNHASLFCQVVVTIEGEPVAHNIGTAALRVDKPLPAVAAAPAPAPMPEAAAAAAETPAKPLSRLDMLRQEAAARAKARAEATP